MRRFLEVLETRYLRHLPYLLGALTFLVCSVFLASAMLHTRQSRPTTPPIFDTAQVVVFEKGVCADCDRFRDQIGRPHQNSDLGAKAPLRYYDVTDSSPPKIYALARGIDAGLTAVVFDIFGREQTRVDWLPKDLEEFQLKLMPHVRRAARDLEVSSAR
jgi:hypothetical protein